MSIEREIMFDVEQLLAGPPQEALASLRRLVDDHLPWLERRAVMAARGEGFSWAEIGRLLGCSRQAARQRFGGLPSVDRLLHPRRLGDPNVALAARLGVEGRDVQRALEADATDEAIPW